MAVIVAMPVWMALKATRVSRVDKMASEITSKPSKMLFARRLVTNVIGWLCIVIFDISMGFIHYSNFGRQNFLEGRELALATPLILLLGILAVMYLTKVAH